MFEKPSDGDAEVMPVLPSLVKDLATVFCTLTPAECCVLAERLQDPGDKLVKLVNKRLTDDNSGNWVRPSADWIQSVLILLARGADTVPAGSKLPTYSLAEGAPVKRAELYQLTATRGTGWDMAQPEEEKQGRKVVPVSYLVGAVYPSCQLVDTYFGESGKDGRAEAFRPKRKNKKRVKKS